MPLVPRFLRPAPPVHVEDTWPSIGRTRHRMVAEIRASRGAEPAHALPDPTPPEDARDERPVEPEGDQRTPTPEPEHERPWEAPVSVAAENAQAERALAPRAPSPTPIKHRAPVPLPVPIADTERRALRGRARAMPDEAAFICDTLRLARLCSRAPCRRSDRCRGHPRICLDTTGESVPAEVFEWAVLVAEARQDGEPADDVEAMYPEEALAWRCWVAALEARVRR